MLPLSLHSSSPPEIFSPDVTDPTGDATFSSSLSPVSGAGANRQGPRRIVKFHRIAGLEVTQLSTGSRSRLARAVRGLKRVLMTFGISPCSTIMQLSVPALQEWAYMTMHTKWMLIRNSPMRAFSHYRSQSFFPLMQRGGVWVCR